MLSKNWLYADNVEICDGISIRIPTVREVLDHEDEYYGYEDRFPTKSEAVGWLRTRCAYA